MKVNQLKAGVTLNYTLIILHTVIGLLYTPFMLRMMGQSEYGLYSLVASVIGYLTILDLGLGNAVIRYTAKFRAENKKEEQFEMFGMFFVLYLIISFVAFIIGCGLYQNVDTMFGDTMTKLELSKIKFMMLMLIFNMAFTFPMSIFGSIMTAYERFVFPKVVSIIRILLNTVVMICLLKMGYKAIAMVVVLTVFNVITLISNYIYCKKILNIKMHFRKFEWGLLKEVAVYSFWIFLNAIMDKVYWSTGQFVLGAFVGTAAVAVFAIAIQLESMYMQFSTALTSVFLPKVTNIVTTSNDKTIISDLFIRTGRIQFTIMAMILSGFIVFGRQFILLWAGPGYEDSYIICILFFVALFPPLIQTLGITILQARNQMKFRSLLYIFIALVALVFQIILAKQYGGIGCAYSIACALLLGQGFIMNIYYYKKQHINIVKFWKEILKMSFIPCLLTIAFKLGLNELAIDNWSKWIISVFIFSLIYIPLFWIFSMNNNEKNLILNLTNKIRYRIKNKFKIK